MSDHFLRLIPEEPEFEPSDEAVVPAINALKAMLPDAGNVTAGRFPKISFIDQGSNFERVLCPHCEAEITDDWGDWMDEGFKQQFIQRTVLLPCCAKEADLNNLIYKWPAGFAKFVLEAMNPNIEGWLDTEAQNEIEAILGCRIRQILAHY